MIFLRSIEGAFRNSFNFKGRAKRTEFWCFMLLQALVMAPLIYIDERLNPGDHLGKMSAVVGLAHLLFLMPSLSLTVRRLHDVDRSGWWMLLALTVVGLPVLIYWHCIRGTEGCNRFDAAVRVKTRMRVQALPA
jgi:uncharacterized membrane protein YhaH (DUF805 family)